MKHQFQQKLKDRMEKGSLRSLSSLDHLVDFYSNDYLGLSKLEVPFLAKHGSTGSRLISGNVSEAVALEDKLATLFNAEAALVFNSGYDANLGFFSSVPQRGEVILYDELIHASVRDGIRLSSAQSFKFKHNDLADLERLLAKQHTTVFVAIESLYSMDGDSAPIGEFVRVCEKYAALLVVDEAHAVGVLGEAGRGLSYPFARASSIFARLITFGKAYGTHGAAILGSEELKQFLINFARSFIYSTALPPQQYATIEHLVSSPVLAELQTKLHENIAFFRKNCKVDIRLSSDISPIQCILTPGNEHAKHVSYFLQNKGFAVKAILSPTVPPGKERIRICLHAFNTEGEISNLLIAVKEALSIH
jgi:8-amino-7-oxononanoate synthase